MNVILHYICFIFNFINIVEKSSCRKTTWGKTSLEEMESAAAEVKEGKMSLRAAARDRNIDKSSLLRFMKKKENGEVKSVAWGAVAEAKRIFTDEMEEELAKHLKQLADQFHGLPPVKCCQLAFEYAAKNNIPVPANWKKTQCAGRLGCARHHMIP